MRCCLSPYTDTEGKRLAAMSHGRLYQRRIKNAFDKKVRPRKFNEGDLVLKKMSHAVKDNRGKWAPNYEGPFVVKRAFSGGALILTHMDGEELPSPRRARLLPPEATAFWRNLLEGPSGPGCYLHPPVY